MRERGYAVTTEELEPGLVAVAAPVISGTDVVAALSVSGPAGRLTGRTLTHAADRCMSAGRTLSVMLGCSPPAAPAAPAGNRREGAP